jgi:hypothetical protein
MRLDPIRRLALATALFITGLVGSPAFASVEIGFYARELGTNFPHAFVVLKGTVDATGEQVDTSLGFTAHSVTPALLFGAVRGEVEVLEAGYVARSNRQFSVTLTDDQYRRVLAVAEEWRNAPQPSYRLRLHSCVHFVSALAAAIGLRVDNDQRLMNRPRSFLERVRALNPQLGGREVAASPAAAAEGAPPTP